MMDIQNFIGQSSSEADRQREYYNRMKIAKSDDDKHLAFGWANVAIRADGEEIEDWQEDIIEPEELENAAYQYVLLYREGGEWQCELQQRFQCQRRPPGFHKPTRQDIDFLVGQCERRGYP